MKITKNTFIITATAALLAGCGSTIIPSLSLPMEGPETASAKTAEFKSKISFWLQDVLINIKKIGYPSENIE